MTPDYDSYATRMIKPSPLVDDIITFDEELEWFMEDPEKPRAYVNSVFSEVAQPMHRMWVAWKAKEIFQAMEHSKDIKPDDWHLACYEWLERRKDKWMETL